MVMVMVMVIGMDDALYNSLNVVGIHHHFFFWRCFIFIVKLISALLDVEWR